MNGGNQCIYCNVKNTSRHQKTKKHMLNKKHYDDIDTKSIINKVNQYCYSDNDSEIDMSYTQYDKKIKYNSIVYS